MINVVIHSSASLGKALRASRREQGLTQAELARATGVAQPTISKIERGVADVSLSTLLRLLAPLRLELVVHPRRTTDAAGIWGA